MHSKKNAKSAMMLMLSIILMLNIVWLPNPVVKADEDPSNGILMGLETDVNSVESGRNFTYRITFSFSGLIANGFDFSTMKIVLPMPAGVEYVNHIPLSILSGHAVNGDQVEFSLNSGAGGPAEGTSYALQVNARFLPHVTPNGFTGTTEAFIVQDDVGGPVELERSNPVTVTAIAAADWEMTKTRVSPLPVPMVGGEVQYEIFLNNNKSGQHIGVIDVENLSVWDVLPAQAEFVSASPAPTTAPAVGETGVIEWAFAGSHADDMRFYVTVRYPAAKVNVADTVTNTAHASYTVPGEPGIVMLSDDVFHGFTDSPLDQGPGGIYKRINQRQQEISPGQEVEFYIGGIRNRANVPISEVVIEDMTPVRDNDDNPVFLDFTGMRTATFHDATVTYDVYYTTAAVPGPADWLHWRAVDSDVSTVLDIADLGGINAGDIKGIQFRFPGELPPSFSQTSDFEMTYTLRAGSLIVDGNFITNTVKMDYVFDGVTKDASDSANVHVWGPRPLVRIDKTRLGSGPFVPSSENADQFVEFEIHIANTSYASADFVDPIIFDVLPSGFTFDSWSLGASSNFDPAGLQMDPAIADPPAKDADGKTLLRWIFPGGTAMPVNSSFVLKVKAKIDMYSPATTSTNIAGLSTNAGYFNDYYFNPLIDDVDDFIGDGLNVGTYIQSSADVTVNKVAELGSYKLVRGELDDKWVSGKLPAGCNMGDPCDELARTLEGGRVDYKLVVKNNSNFDVDNIVVVDVLPRIGDQGALVGARGTQWGTVLTEELAADPRYEVYYHTSTDHVKISTVDGWSLTPPDDLTTVTALKFVFDPTFVLEPGDEVPIEWTMKAPVGTPVDAIAWNSFAHQAREVGGPGSMQLQPAEPPKVGVYISSVGAGKFALGNYVWADLNENGIQDPGEPGINGVRADLLVWDGFDYVPYMRTFTDGSPAVPVFTLTGPDQNGNPGYYLFPNLPSDRYKVQFTLPDLLPEDYKYDVGTPHEYANTANRFSSWTLKGQGGDPALDSNVGGADLKITTDEIDLNADDMTIDAGLLPPLGEIGDYVWQDVNGNGIQDAGDMPIPGVEVQLLDENGDPVVDAFGDPRIEITDADGKYAFTGLLPGNYRVKFPEKVVALGNESIITFVRQGADRTVDSNPNAEGLSDVITLQLGEINHTIDAGYVLPVEIGDYVWEDLNFDGVQDGGDQPFQGVAVRLLDTSNQPVKAADGVTNRIATTDANGRYKFDDLLPGTYRVEFELPAGYGFTRKNIGGNPAVDSDANRLADNVPTLQTSGRTDNIAVTAPGDSNMTIDAGLVKLVSLGDFVWRDANVNGLQDPDEPGVSGVNVTLYYDDIDPNAPYRTAVTNATGNYMFSLLYPGNYTVQFERPNGFIYTDKGDGMAPAVDSNVNVPADPQIAVAKTDQIALGADNDTIDAGLIPLSSIGDYVWVDNNVNDNGLQDIGENGLAGVRVELFDGTGNVKIANNAYGRPIADIMTDGTGAYQFDNLAPGDYVVKFTLPHGYTFAGFQAGDPEKDSDALVVDPLVPNIGMTNMITLEAGQSDLTIDAGALAYASLGNLVWHDHNGDGIQQAGEPGIAGVTVTLYEADGVTEVTSDAFGAAISPTVTDADGHYTFANLPPGTYRVKFDLPAGYTDFTVLNVAGSTTANDSDADSDGLTGVITLAWNEHNDTIDAGVVEITSLGDLLWYDRNGNGIQDAGEQGVPGILIELYDAADLTAPIASKFTDADGKYLFDGLWPGNYRIKFYLPSDYYMFSPRFDPFGLGNDETDSDADPAVMSPTFGMTEEIVIVSTGSDLSLDAGIVELASIGDTLWEETVYDGIQDGEPGYAGVTVHLLYADDTPVLDELGNPVTVVTDENGEYLFKKLIPGDYKVKFDLPAGYIFTMKNAAGSTDANDSDVHASGSTDVVTLMPGEHNVHIDAGIVKLASLGDRVWMDKLPGGIQDDDEDGVSGVTVQLLTEFGLPASDAFGNPQITMTNAGGNYMFQNLVPGKYKVRFALPHGYVFVDKHQGGDSARDSDANSSGANVGETDIITLSPGESNMTIDAGLIKLVKLGDKLWVDTGIIGHQDGEPADAAAAGVTVRLLDGSGAPVLHGGIPVTTVTDADGLYEFTDLLPGTYQVQFDLPAGYLFTRQNVNKPGVTEATDSDADATGRTPVITLIAGEDNLTIDAGIVLPASLGDYVWIDTNHNGIQDAAEQGHNNVTVELYDEHEMLVAAVITQDNGGLPGYYTFTDLIPGDYVVKFKIPAGYMATSKGMGGDPASDSDIDNKGRTEAVTLLPGQHNPDIDAGIRRVPAAPLSSIGDYVWVDMNENGIQDEEESGLNGVTVELYNDTGALIDTEVTVNGPDGKPGYYIFEKLLPGQYTVKFILPDGYAFTEKNSGHDRTVDSKADAGGMTDSIMLPGNTQYSDVDAGLIPLASLGDYVWIDSNDNGIQDADEPGLNGVAVTLLNEDGVAIASTATGTNALGQDGYYLFDGLKSGVYKVKFDLPEGYRFTTQNASGSSAATDSDANAEGVTGTIAVTAGASIVTIDAGLVPIEHGNAAEQPEGDETTEEENSERDDSSIGIPGGTPADENGASGTSGIPGITPADGDGASGGSGISAPAGQTDDASGKSGTAALPKTGETMPVLPYVGFGMAVVAASLLIARRFTAKK